MVISLMFGKIGSNRFSMDNSTMDEELIRTPEQRRRDLYERQVEMLNLFLERGAISQEQYDKSYGDLTEKMGYK